MSDLIIVASGTLRLSRGKPGRNVVSAAAVLAMMDDAIREAAGGSVLAQIHDPEVSMRWFDVAVCDGDWGWALVYNNPDEGECFGSFGAAPSEMRTFSIPRGEEVELDRRWFIARAKARAALTVFCNSGKLWKGVKWRPDPSADVMAD